MTVRKSLFVIACLVFIPVPVVSQRPARPGLNRSAVIRRARDATVSLRVTRGADSVQGSGFFVAPIGILVTAAHVVDGATFIQVSRSSGITNEVAGVYLIDRDHDFALLKIAIGNAPVVRLGNSDSVKIGERVMAIGSPLGLDATVSDGLISADRLDEDTRLLQISVPVSPGSSGGPLLSQDGTVVGVVVSGIRGGGAENLNFALPINYVRQALSSTAIDPVPMSDAITVTRGSKRPSIVHAAESRSVGTAGRVNDSIAFDWKALDGASAYAENNDHTRTVRTRTVYNMTTDPNGAAVLERHSTLIWNQDYKDQFRDETRTLLDSHHNSREFYERFSGNPERYTEGRWEASLTDGHWQFDSNFHGSSSALLRGGALPDNLIAGALAALPDSLPKSLYVWFFDWDTSLVARVRPVRFDFGEHTEIDVSISKRGDPCGPRTPTTKRKLPVVWVTTTDGAERSVSPILAKRPHMHVDRDTECLFVPGLSPD